MYKTIRLAVPHRWWPARHHNTHEVPVDHLPPLGAAVTPLAQRRSQRDATGRHRARSV